jgi:hypothetical protein
MAIRRLWSQSSSEEKRLAARHVSLVRGRMLTLKNWRNNTPQRIIVLPENHLDMHICTSASRQKNFSYGIPYISNGRDKLGLGIIDDTLNDTQLIPIPDTQMSDALFSLTHDNNVILGRVVPIHSTLHTISIYNYVNNEEFVIFKKEINK